MTELNEFLLEHINSLPEDIDDEIEQKEEKIMMRKLKEVDGFMDWIDKVINRDVKNHFVAQNEAQRLLVKGMAQRLIDFKKRLIESDKPDVIVSKRELTKY